MVKRCPTVTGLVRLEPAKIQPADVALLLNSQRWKFSHSHRIRNAQIEEVMHVPGASLARPDPVADSSRLEEILPRLYQESTLSYPARSRFTINGIALKTARLHLIGSLEIFPALS